MSLHILIINKISSIHRLLGYFNECVKFDLVYEKRLLRENDTAINRHLYLFYKDNKFMLYYIYFIPTIRFFKVSMLKNLIFIKNIS